MQAFAKSCAPQAGGKPRAMTGGAVKIDSIRHLPEHIEAYRHAGYWTDTTTVDLLERHAREQPDRLALVDGRVRLNYAMYADRSRRLAARFIALGLTSDD